RPERYSRRTLVNDLVSNLEQVLVIDKDDAVKFQPCSVIVCKSHGVSYRETSGILLLPHRVGVRQLYIDPRAGKPTEFRIKRIRPPGRHQQDCFSLGSTAI